MRSMMFSLLIVLLIGAGVEANGVCDGKNYRGVRDAPEDLLIYGLTQDCQMFFIRPSQLHLLSSIRVDKRHSFCYANLVQLHVKSHDTLLLTFKQATNRICTLEVHVPALSMLFGDHLFRYSLLNSLPYASCSHSKDQSFHLEPDLSFMDPLYSDVIYFIDALSSGPSWKVIQFLLKNTGNMSMMNNLTVKLQSRSASANEFLVSIDNQRDKLYRRNRFDNLIYQQCGFEMLFRPKDSEVNSFETPSRGYGAIVNGQAVEENIMIYVETDRSTDPPSSRLNMLSIDDPNHVACLSATTFSFDVGIITEKTMEKLKNEPRPPFGTKVTNWPQIGIDKTRTKPSPSSRDKSPPSSAPRRTSTTTSSPPLTSLQPLVVTSPTSARPKGAYSPSKSFFSYEMGGTLASTTSSESMMSNEIPVEKIKEEQEKEEEELNEIIKELKSDDDIERNEDVGELKTRTLTPLSPGSEDSSEEESDDDLMAGTSSDAEAVKSSHHFSIFSSIFIPAILFFSSFV